MTKSELLSTYTAEQLAEMVINHDTSNRINGEIVSNLENKIKKLKEEYAGTLWEYCDSVKKEDYDKEVNRLQSEVEKYRKAFEDAKKERDCQIAEYQKKIEELHNSLRTLDGNLKVSNVVIEETIKNENGEETNTVKFDSIKQFAEYVKCFYTVNLDYIQKVLQGEKINQNNPENITDFLPTEPIKVADMLINAEGEYEHNPIAKALYKEDKGTYHIFDIGELRQIAKHLLIYCNHYKEEE